MKCEECNETCPDHKFGRIKAFDAGWYFTRNGKGYCPKHNPPWLKEWRDRTPLEERKKF